MRGDGGEREGSDNTQAPELSGPPRNLSSCYLPSFSFPFLPSLSFYLPFVSVDGFCFISRRYSAGFPLFDPLAGALSWLRGASQRTSAEARGTHLQSVPCRPEDLADTCFAVDGGRVATHVNESSSLAGPDPSDVEKNLPPLPDPPRPPVAAVPVFVFAGRPLEEGHLWAVRAAALRVLRGGHARLVRRGAKAVGLRVPKMRVARRWFSAECWEVAAAHG